MMEPGGRYVAFTRSSYADSDSLTGLEEDGYLGAADGDALRFHEDSHGDAPAA